MTTTALAPPAYPPPNYDTILRTRLAALLARHGVTIGAAARGCGWSESTLHRRLNLDPADPKNYRRLHTCDVDQLLEQLDLPPDAVDQAVLLPGDRDLLLWVGQHTPSDPLPSNASHVLARGVHGGTYAPYDVILARLVRQGLLAVLAPDADPDPDTWFLRLTPAGQRSLR